MAQTHTQTDRGSTDGHDDSMTESAQWCRFSENLLKIYVTLMVHFAVKYQLMAKIILKMAFG